MRDPPNSMAQLLNYIIDDTRPFTSKKRDNDVFYDINCMEINMILDKLDEIVQVLLFLKKNGCNIKL